MSEQEHSKKPNLKRKKKRSKAQMIKKLAHSRSQGHGSELEPDAYQYMVKILEVINKDFADVDDKAMFANNVYEQMEGREVDHARNQLASRVLESLLPYADFEAIQKLDSAFSASLRPMCSDCFSSHVLQKLISVCSDRGNPKNGVKTEDSNNFKTMALKLCKYVLNNAEEFIRDTYANHVLRTVVMCLSGLIDIPQGQNKQPLERRKVHEDFTKLLLGYCERIRKWPQIQEFGQDELTSGFLQSVLRSLKDIDLKAADKFVKTITAKCFSSNTEDSMSNAFLSESSSRLMEACLEVAKPKRFTIIYEGFFEGKLKKFAQSRETNFSVQRLLDHCPTKEDFEKIFDEISPDLEDILMSSHTGVLSSLANACLRLKAKQQPFIIRMCEILHCDEPEEQRERMVIYVSRLNTHEQFERLKKEKDNPPLHLHGSLILQAMLRFNKPIKVVNSLLSLESEELVCMFGDPKGSRILDAFMDSPFIGEKSREKLVRQLKGYWAQLACSVHGSRCVDKIWENGQKITRMNIMKELAIAGESLRSSRTGSIIYTKLKVSLFKRSEEEWLEAQGKEKTMKNLFADIIAPVSK